MNRELRAKLELIEKDMADALRAPADDLSLGEACLVGRAVFRAAAIINKLLGSI